MVSRVVLSAFLGGFLGVAGLAAAPASAQTTDTVPITPPVDTQTVDHVDHAAAGLAGRGPGGPGGFRVPEGVGVVSPGALLFASFDANHDGKVTTAEIEAGAAAVFAVVDRSNDGAITGFEQADWAATMSGLPDVLSNPMTFDTNQDNSVSKAEFLAGLKRMASQIAPSGDITFAELVRPLSKNDNQADRGPGLGLGSITPRGSTRTGGGRGGPPGGSPNVGGQ